MTRCGTDLPVVPATNDDASLAGERDGRRDGAPGRSVRRRSDLWLAALVVGWTCWALWLSGFVAYLAFRASYFGFASCYPPGGDSPTGTSYVSLWPFGPGCDFFGSRSGPGPGWSLALVALAGVGVGLWRWQASYARAAPRR